MKNIKERNTKIHTAGISRISHAVFNYCNEAGLYENLETIQRWKKKEIQLKTNRLKKVNKNK